MIQRHGDFYGSVPEQLACDGGYASKANLSEAKALGVGDMVFHKKQGLKTLDMASSTGVYGRLRRFRAGMEAAISYLKRCVGLRRCNWRGLEHLRGVRVVGGRHVQLGPARPKSAETESRVVAQRADRNRARPARWNRELLRLPKFKQGSLSRGVPRA